MFCQEPLRVLLAGHQELSPHLMAEKLTGVIKMETSQTKPAQRASPTLIKFVLIGLKLSAFVLLKKMTFSQVEFLCCLFPSLRGFHLSFVKKTKCTELVSFLEISVFTCLLSLQQE